ncbi:MAG: A/G-specific adenine glycosylase [Lachnospiraceae bacterium]|nr:A/G-specific adenine glycosylase [Lachnospiraceae bacterium]
MSGRHYEARCGSADEKNEFERRAAVVRNFTENLLHYYKEKKRSLPWREDTNPYHVWVSEIMLQQTRVEAVKSYYMRFLEALPDVEALANVGEERLLKLWEGLGYYSRARNLQKAAHVIVEEYGGSMPQTGAELIKLPGIGSYTAGAIASISFGEVIPAVDGNVLRVLSRVFADGRDISLPQVKRDYEELLKASMSREQPGEFNQAMMEVGAMVCVPNGQPKCESCPLSSFCEAHANDTWDRYPYKTPKKPRVIENRTVLILRDEKRTAIVKRPVRGLLAGMYEFPVMEGYATKQEVLMDLEDKGIRAVRIQPLEDAVHIFTHKEWHMKAYLIRVDELTAYTPPQGWLFVDAADTRETYPIPSAYAKYRKYIL